MGNLFWGASGCGNSKLPYGFQKPLAFTTSDTWSGRGGGLRLSQESDSAEVAEMAGFANGAWALSACENASASNFASQVGGEAMCCVCDVFCFC